MLTLNLPPSDSTLAMMKFYNNIVNVFWNCVSNALILIAH